VCVCVCVYVCVCVCAKKVFCPKKTTQKSKYKMKWTCVPCCCQSMKWHKPVLEVIQYVCVCVYVFVVCVYLCVVLCGERE